MVWGLFRKRKIKSGVQKGGLVGGPGETRLGVVDRGFGFGGVVLSRCPARPWSCGCSTYCTEVIGFALPLGGGRNSRQPPQNRVLVQPAYNPLKPPTTRQKGSNYCSAYRPVKRLHNCSAYRPKRTLQPEETAYNPFLLQPVSQMSNNPNTMLGSCAPLLTVLATSLQEFQTHTAGVNKVSKKTYGRVTSKPTGRTTHYSTTHTQQLSLSLSLFSVSSHSLSIRGLFRD